MCVYVREVVGSSNYKMGFSNNLVRDLPVGRRIIIDCSCITASLAFLTFTH